MTWLYNLPLELRLAAVGILGVLIGTQVNRFVYRLSWVPRQIGPWAKPPADAPPRNWFDYLPIVGWFALRREAPLHGPGYWLRPMTIEIVFGAGLALLYWFEVQGGLVPDAVTTKLPMDWIHAQFAAHTLLIALMATASVIDIDEKLIPDQITVYGALAGLVLAALVPMSRLPVWDAFLYGRPPATTWTGESLLMIASPNDPPDWFFGPRGLATAIGCFAAWWLAILPSIWTTRFGVAKAVRYKLAGMRRAVMPRKSRPHEGWRGYLPILGLGLALIIAVWALQGRVSSSHWHALFTALVGMAAGGAIVWGVRIIGSHALRKEAMGFGDVTLVAMIGVYLGWQPCLMLFFIAPFIGVVIALLNMLLRGQADIWYGPFLCAAALIVIVFWAKLWHDFGAIFTMGLFVPALVVIMFALMWAMLIFWRFIKEQIIFRSSPE